MTESSVLPDHSPAGFSGLLGEIVPVLSFLRRWWPLAVAMTILTSMTTVVVVIARGVEYQVSAALFYKLGTELAPPPTMGKDPIVITRRAEDVNDEIEILTSPDLIHEVVHELGEDFFKAPPPATAFAKFKRRVKDKLAVFTGAVEDGLIQAGLRRRLSMLDKIELGVNQKLKVELVRESDVISVTLDTPSPEAGVAIVEKLLDAYQARHLQVHQELAVKDFLTRQTEELRDQLSASTERLLEFQTSADLWSPDEQQKMLLDNRKTLQLQVATTTSREANLAKFVDNLGKSISELPEEVELSRNEQINPAIVGLEDRLASLNMNLAVVETSYRTTSRESQDRRKQVEGLQRRIDTAPVLVPHSASKGINLARQDLTKEFSLKQAELTGIQDQLSVEKSLLEDIDGALKEQGASIARFQQLQREHRLLEQKYALYTENFEKADISAVMNLSQISNMELITPPTASMEPVKPRLTIVAAVGVVSGLALAFAIAIAFDLRAAMKTRSTLT